MVHHVLTRQTLHARIWAEPVCAVALSLGVSDVGLLKACRRAGVQTPPRGYWTRVRRLERLPDPPVLEPRPDLRDWVVIAPAQALRDPLVRRASRFPSCPTLSLLSPPLPACGTPTQSLAQPPARSPAVDLSMLVARQVTGVGHRGARG